MDNRGREKMTDTAAYVGLKPDERRLLRKIENAGRRGVPALTSIEEARAIDAVRATGLVVWTGTRWVSSLHSQPLR
jgi:hypothetical protein